MPVKEIGRIAHKYGIVFMVDGAQSAGSVPIDVKDMNIDLLAAPGHKGLLGPQGTGFLYVKEGIQLNQLIEGGTGTNSKDLIQPDELPEGYESGTINAPGFIGLGYSVRLIERLGIENIRKYEDELIKDLDQALRDMKNVSVYGPDDTLKKTGIGPFKIKKMSCEEVCDRLNREYGIASRGGFHCAGLAHLSIGTFDCGAVRLSVSPFNTNRDIRSAIRAVYRIQNM